MLVEDSLGLFFGCFVVLDAFLGFQKAAMVFSEGVEQAVFS